MTNWDVEQKLYDINGNLCDLWLTVFCNGGDTVLFLDLEKNKTFYKKIILDFF